MAKIEQVLVKGLWGLSDVRLDVNEDVTFLIGVNGTGKTTLMNLIGAVLTRDYETLASIEFSEIKIVFKSGRSKPALRVVKDDEPSTPGDEVVYYLRDAASAEELAYPVGRAVVRKFDDGVRRRFYFEQDEELEKRIAKLIRVVWLTVHRANVTEAAEYGYRRRQPLPMIDIKLEQLAARLARYFSSLQTQARAESDEFQRGVLRGLVGSGTGPNSPFQNFAFASKRDHQLDATRRVAEQVFEDAGIALNEIAAELGEMFAKYKSLKERVGRPEGERVSVSFNMDDIADVFRMQRLEETVHEWQRHDARRRELFHRRDKFLDLLNGMFRNKRLEIDETNELVAKTSGGIEMPLTRFSSGEKQMIILFGEPLLRGDEDWIYLADEPELSLHVEWQERLVAGVRDLSPNAQVFFATHSPDVVSTYSNSIRDMADLLS